MNNQDAYSFFTSRESKDISTIAKEFISYYSLDDDAFQTIRRKFSKIRDERRAFVRRADLSTWNGMSFYDNIQTPSLTDSYNSDEEVFQSIVPASKSIVTFDEDLSRTKRKHLNEMTAKGIRNRLSSLLTHLEAVAKQEDVSSKVLSAYLMMLCSQAEYDFTSAKFCKDIIAKGSFGSVCNKMNCDKAAFLMDSLEIGKKKYIDLRRLLLTDGLQLPGYNRLATHRFQICLTSDMFSIDREHPVGIGVSYYKLLTHTLNRILTVSGNEVSGSTLKIRISDGLDGSGCHRVYQQVTHPNVSTKSFILFGFKVISISTTENKIIWKNPLPNSPFSIRPVAILALQENEDNIKYLMETLINKESTHITEQGVELTCGLGKVEIQRSQLDGKMAKILSGAGGACCQFCTATFKQIHDPDIVKDGFPINRSITDAKVILYLKRLTKRNFSHYLLIKDSTLHTDLYQT